MKAVLITGGSGFIGRNLVEQLGGKYRVWAPSHAELDLLDEEAVESYLAAHSFDAVIHCATENATINAKRDRSRVLYNNCRMFCNLARCHRLYGKMLSLGSGAEYDRRHYLPRMSEDYFGTHIPVDDYGFSKYLIARLIEASGNIVDLRLFGVFGPYEDWEIRFISNACCRAVWDLPITIRQNVLFDYLYIDDLVEVLTWFLENQARERFYNVCTGRVYDLYSLAGMVLRAAGKQLEIRVARPGMGLEYSGDNTRLLKEMSGFRFREMEECVRELYRWYQEHKELIDPERLR